MKRSHMKVKTIHPPRYQNILDRKNRLMIIIIFYCRIWNLGTISNLQASKWRWWLRRLWESVDAGRQHDDRDVVICFAATSYVTVTF